MTGNWSSAYVEHFLVLFYENKMMYDDENVYKEIT